MSNSFLNQSFMGILKGQDEELKQELKSFLQKEVFTSVGVTVSFDAKWVDIVIHFGPAFFSQDTFMHGSGPNRKYNNAKIERFFKFMSNQSNACEFTLNPFVKPSATNLHMEIDYDLPDENSKTTVAQTREYLKGKWDKLKDAARHSGFFHCLRPRSVYL